MDSSNLYCICRGVYNEHRFMIECHACKEWFHGDCVGILEKEADQIEEYHCTACQNSHGPSKLKSNIPRASHKPEEFELIEHPAIKNFYQALDDTSFLDSSHVVTYLANATSFSAEYVYENTLQKPILIESIVGLGLIVPPISTSKDIENYLPPNHLLNIHDILENEERTIKLTEWIEHLDSPENLDNISIVDKLDINGTKLSRIIKPPRQLRQFDLVESSWPKTDDNEDFMFGKPKQSLFLSMGDAGSFVDFQIGMVGASVWVYNMLGARTIYLVPPTDENLKIYEERTKINSCDDRFFGDLANACYKLDTRENEFVYIPGGWIFASYLNTKGVSLVGEFCNMFSLPHHIQCYELQKRLKSLNTVRYPHFEVLVWCAAEHIHMLLSSKEFSYNRHGLMESAKALVTILRKWISKKEEHLHAQEIPPHINPTKLTNSIVYSIGKINRGNNPKVSPLKVKTKPGPSKRVKSPAFHSDHVNIEPAPRGEKLLLKFNKSLLYSEQNNSAEANVAQGPIKLRLPKIIMNNEVAPPEKPEKPVETKVAVVTKSGRKRKRPKSLADFVDSGKSSKPLYDSDDSISKTANILSLGEVEKPEIAKIRKRLKKQSEKQAKQQPVSPPTLNSPSITPLSIQARGKRNTYNEESPDEFESEKFLSKCKQDSYYIYPTIGAQDVSDEHTGESDNCSSATPLKLKVRLPIPDRQPTPPPKTPNVSKKRTESVKKGLRTPKQRLGKLLKIDKSFIRR